MSDQQQTKQPPAIDEMQARMDKIRHDSAMHPQQHAMGMAIGIMLGVDTYKAPEPEQKGAK